jgi:hypothetical protein
MLSQIRDLVVLFMCYCFADTLFSSFADSRFTRSYSAIEVSIYFKILEVKVPIVFFRHAGMDVTGEGLEME